MSKHKDELGLTAQDILDALEADQYAELADDILLELAELNPELCPPDRRYVRDGHEAWVYNHGNIAELVFVKT